MRFGIVLLTFLLVVITTGIVTYFLPKKYRAQTTLELRDPVKDPDFQKGLRFQGSGDPGTSYATTQFEIMQSTDVLYPVVETNDLERHWGTDGVPLSREGAFYRLRGMLGLKPISRNTDMVELSISSPDPAEAAQKLVNAVSQSYIDAKTHGVSSGINKRIQGVGKSGACRTSATVRRVMDLQSKLQQMRRDQSIVDTNTDSARRKSGTRLKTWSTPKSRRSIKTAPTSPLSRHSSSRSAT